MADAQQVQDKYQSQRKAEQPQKNEDHYGLLSRRSSVASRTAGRRSRVRWCVKVIGSPVAIQPPITLPIRPRSRAIVVATALLRVATARSGSGVGAAATHEGVPDNPAYQPPRCPAAPNPASTSSSGIATSQTIAPCKIAGSERRMPATRPAAHPPATNAKNAPPMLKTRVTSRIFFQST